MPVSAGADRWQSRCVFHIRLLRCRWPVSVALPVTSERFITAANFFCIEQYLCLVNP